MPETKKYYHNLDVDNNKVINLLLNPLTTAQRIAVGTLLGPTDEGYTTYDTTANQQYFWDGAAWQVGGGSATWGSITGTLTAQTDLTTYLSTNYYPLSSNPAGYLTSASISGMVTGSGTATRVAFWDSGSSISSDADLYWDNANKILGIGTATPNTTYKLHVVGSIATTTGVNVDSTVGIKTGLYGGANVMTFWAGNNQLSTYTLVGNTAGSYFSHTLPFNNSGGSSGVQNAWRIASDVVATGANSMIHNQLIIDPGYVQGTLGTGLVRGVYYNPSVASLNGVSHIAWENTSGDIIHGNLATGGVDEMVTVDVNGKLKKQVIPSATSPLTTKGDIYTRNATADDRLPVGVDGQILAADNTAATGLKWIPNTATSLTNATAAGTNTYTATVPGIIAYADGEALLVRFTNGNTGSCTLNINGLGAIPLYRNNDGPLIGGDIQDGGEMLCVYNSSVPNFQCIGTTPNSLVAYVTNDEPIATLTKGQVVYAFSGTGDRMTVKLANNVGDATSAQTVGLVLSPSIAPNQKGFIMTQGLLDGLSILPTATWSDGDPVYLDSVAGGITPTKPYAPNHLVYLGVVTTASNGSSGRMYVKVQNGYELDELHNVQAQTPALNDTLWYDNTVTPAQWKTASIPTILGYTPFDEADYNWLPTISVQALGSTMKGMNVGLPSGYAGVATQVALVDAGLRLVPYYLIQPATITGVKWYQNTQGNYTADNYNGVGLYTYSAGTLTLVASSTNDGNIWKGVSQTFQSKAFSSPYTAAVGLYFIGVLYNSSAQVTAPGLGGNLIQNAGLAGYDFTDSAKMCSTLAAQTTMPATALMSGTTANNSVIGIFLY